MEYKELTQKVESGKNDFLIHVNMSKKSTSKQNLVASQKPINHSIAFHHALSPCMHKPLSYYSSNTKAWFSYIIIHW